MSTKNVTGKMVWDLSRKTFFDGAGIFFICAVAAFRFVQAFQQIGFAHVEVEVITGVLVVLWYCNGRFNYLEIKMRQRGKNGS